MNDPIPPEEFDQTSEELLPLKSDDLKEPLPPPSNSPQFTRFGCITAIILLGLGILICSAGNRWMFEPQSILSFDVDSLFTSTLLSSASQWGLLLIIGLVLLFLRQDRFRLLRGIGAGLLIGAAYTAVNGALIAWEAPLTYPGITDWVPPAILSGIAIILIPILGRGSYKSARSTAILGLGVGLLVTFPWAFMGSLGEPNEMAAALFEGMAFGLWMGLAVSMVFYFEPNLTKERHLLWSTFVAAGFAAAMLPTFLAGRGGYVMSAVLITPLIALVPLIAIIAVWPPQLSSRNRWLPVAALCFGYLSIPLLFFEGVELEFMPETGAKLAAGLGFVVIFSLLAAAVWLVTRIISGAKAAGRRSLIALIPAFLLIGTGALTTTGGPWQTDTFFVLMVDQADTDFAADITDRNERVAAVYTTLVDQATASQADIRQFLDEQNAAYTAFYLVNGIEVEGSARLKFQLSQRPDVERILDSPHPRPERTWFDTVTDIGSNIEDAVTDAATPPTDEPTEPTWGLIEINAPQVWNELDITGEGIIVGSADSGVEFTHPALEGSYLGSPNNHDYTWFDPAVGNSSPADSGGHGTHTTGTIVGSNNIGVAPGAKWIACRNLPKNLGNPADYLACMQFLFAPFPIGGDPFTEGDPARGAHLTNNSWGCPPEEGCDGFTLGIGVHHLRNAGQMMVISNGNSGPGCDTTGVPATNDDAFSVGALRESGEKIAVFSSRGPAVDYDGDLIIKPDIIAPGVNVISSVPGGRYASSQGTSMAGPHVAGVVALLWSAAPELIGDIDQTEQILIDTARQIQTEERCLDSNTNNELNTDTGHGIVDAYAAVKSVTGDQ